MWWLYWEFSLQVDKTALCHWKGSTVSSRCLGHFAFTCCRVLNVLNEDERFQGFRKAAALQRGVLDPPRLWRWSGGKVARGAFQPRSARCASRARNLRAPERFRARSPPSHPMRAFRRSFGGIPRGCERFGGISGGCVPPEATCLCLAAAPIHCAFQWREVSCDYIASSFFLGIFAVRVKTLLPIYEIRMRWNWNNNSNTKMDCSWINVNNLSRSLNAMKLSSAWIPPRPPAKQNQIQKMYQKG